MNKEQDEMLKKYLLLLDEFYDLKNTLSNITKYIQKRIEEFNNAVNKEDINSELYIKILNDLLILGGDKDE